MLTSPARSPRLQRSTSIAIACLSLTLTMETAHAQLGHGDLPKAKFPANVRTVEGTTLDVAALAEARRVVIVTLKATWCPVCQEQLARIHRALLNPKECGLELLVLSPGPAEALKEIKARLGVGYSFIEDRDLKIAGSLGLKLARNQIHPSILILERDLSVGWMQRGRNGAFFGDPDLVREVNCLGVI